MMPPQHAAATPSIGFKLALPPDPSALRWSGFIDQRKFSQPGSTERWLQRISCNLGYYGDHYLCFGFAVAVCDGIASGRWLQMLYYVALSRNINGWAWQIAKQLFVQDRAAQQAAAERIPPAELVGRRVEIDGQGTGVVTGFQKAVLGTSQHQVLLDGQEKEKWVSLARHGNGKAKFIMLRQDVEVTTNFIVAILHVSIMGSPCSFMAFLFIASIVLLHASVRQSSMVQKMRMGVDPLSVMMQSYNRRAL